MSKDKIKDKDLKPQVYKDPRPAEYFDRFHAKARWGIGFMYDLVRVILTLPTILLFRAREIVREHCANIELPYTETGLLRSYGIITTYLNRVGLGARDPFDCPERVAMGR